MSLQNWQGFGEDYLPLAIARGAGALYLHQSWRKVPKTAQDDASMDTSADAVSPSRSSEPSDRET